jgi:hypothetical protein
MSLMHRAAIRLSTVRRHRSKDGRRDLTTLALCASHNGANRVLLPHTAVLSLH